MLYEAGDIVIPLNVATRPSCRVCDVRPTAPTGPGRQVLELEPLEGFWPAGTRLLRLDTGVEPVAARQRLSSAAERRPGVVAGNGHAIDELTAPASAEAAVTAPTRR